MKNTTLATALLLSLGLAACQGNQGPATPGAGAAAADATASTQAPAAVPAGEPLPDALPQGVEIDFPHHFTKREVGEASNGKEARLRYTVEYLDGDAASVAASLAGSMMDAGFQSGKWRVRDDGRIQFAANKAGYGQMRAEVRPAGKRKLRNAAAKGTVALGWPVQEAGTAAAGDVAAAESATAQ
jgi:hypothetical protein